ncbi:Serine/threonine/tyrosine-protein kinase HT1 [Linum perenne]
MSYRRERNGGGGAEVVEDGYERRSGGRSSTGRQSKSGSGNGSIVSPRLSIDETRLIDANSLFIGLKIGEGAHGKVYEGRFGDRVVAIKVLHRGSTSDERSALENRFAREINMMSRVKHDNLVKFIGACKDPLMAIVTELLPGMSLRKYLTSIRPNKLELPLALSFALDIARALDCLHANGIIHRDLKPDNLLLTADQKSVKLADFGLAREESVTEMMTAETGTYRWMAPEQERPNMAGDIPPELAFIIQSCWVEDPNMRPSFSQIIRMLNAFLFTLSPPSPSALKPESNDPPPPETSSPSSNGSVTEFSARARGKFGFLKQLFAVKRTKSS